MCFEHHLLLIEPLNSLGSIWEAQACFRIGLPFSLYCQALLCNPRRGSCLKLWSSMSDLICKLPRCESVYEALDLEKEGACLEDSLDSRCELVKEV